MVMKKTILPGLLLLGSFASFVACRAADAGHGEVGAEAAITDSEGDEEFYQRRITCIHHRRERTRAGAELKRGFHLKTHGCFEGQMTVNPKLDADLKVGVFAMHTVGKDKPYDHRVLARLTNINQLADSKLDLRGLGIKVVGVPGAKM